MSARFRARWQGSRFTRQLGGDPHGYPQRPHPVGGNGEIFLRGAREAGITAKVGPVAITNGRFGNRPHCIYRGFCLQGCKVNAKASPLITHVPDALAHGAEIRADAMVTGVEVDQRTGRATGVHYIRRGVPHFQRAAAVALAGYSIETPRLLLRLRAEMKLPGLAWLEMVVGRDHDGMTTYRQRAIFQPRGLAGHAYWRAISPFHGVVFGGMLRNITAAAERASRAADKPAPAGH